MGVQYVGVDTARGAHEARDQERHEQGKPRPPPQVAGHAVAVRDPEVAELLGPDDFHVDASRTNVLDRVCDESSRCISRVPGVRGRENADTHQLSTRKTA